MKRNKLLKRTAMMISTGVILAFSILFAQQDGQIYIIAKKIYTSDNGRVVTNGGILIKGGEIVKVEAKARPPKNIPLVDFSDAVIVPGLIDAFSFQGFHQEDFNVRTEPPGPWRAPLAGIYRLYFGLAERSSPPPRVEARFKASDAVFSKDPSLRKSLAEGIIMAAIAIPTDNLTGGMSFIARLEGGSASGFVMEDPAGAVFSFTGEENVTNRYGELKKMFLDAQDYRKSWEKYRKDLKKYEEQKRKEVRKGEDGPKGKKEEEKPEEELKEPREPKKDENHEAILLVLDRKIPALVRASRINEIQAALDLQNEFRIRLVLVGGHEAYKIPQDLWARKVAVIAGPETILDKKGIKVNYIKNLLANNIPVAFCSSSAQGASFIPYQLSYAIQHGLSRTQALDMVTAHAAEILGISGKAGSIKSGRNADFVVLNGEPFDLSTKVKWVYINGQRYFSGD
jgi:imidazolonepropionase-like amidohydrolase